MTVDMIVRQMRWEATGVLSVRLENTDGSAVAPWSAGAHLDLHLAPGLIRQYSLCGEPADASGYRVAVLRDPGSRGGSEHVHGLLRPGHVIAVSEPRNNFELFDAPNYVFIAGGIGITPILAMIGEAHRRGADWRLHYGGRSRESMAFLDQLAEFGDRVHVVGEDTDGILDLPGILGTPQPGTLVYACGPEGLLGAVEATGKAWPDGAIQLERFKAVERESTGEDGGDGPVRVVCSRAGITVTVPPEDTILDALERGGLDLDNSCREGLCGTCETRVLAGVPDHRDSLLSTSERESGKTMLICVSRAQTDELVLDI
jgi:ferredoxin-NADP reductase